MTDTDGTEDLQGVVGKKVQNATPSAIGALFERNPLPMWIYDLDSLEFLAVNESAGRYRDIPGRPQGAAPVRSILLRMGTTGTTEASVDRTLSPRERILDCVVQLAEEGSWESVHLHQVAERLGIELADIQAYFGEKDQLIDAWFDRADRAALAVTRSTGFDTLPAANRLEAAILAWLDHLAPHRRVVREMIGAKAELGHIHIQIPAVMRISRTVQWFREVAGYRDTLPLRAVAESVHTGIYLLTFTHWMYDDSSGAERTRRLLGQLLRKTACIPPWDKPVTTD